MDAAIVAATPAAAATSPGAAGASRDARSRALLDMFTFKQYPGQQQVDLKVKIEVPGAWFGKGSAGALTSTERREKYEAIAVEYDPARLFRGAQRGRGHGSQTVEAIRFICPDDATEEVEHTGYWMKLSDWNRYRNDTYRDRREDELPYLPPSELDTAMATLHAKEQEKSEQDPALASVVGRLLAHGLRAVLTVCSE